MTSNHIPDASALTGWTKSSHSDSGGDCVEIARHHDGFAIRDSKNPTGPALSFTAAELHAFLAATKTGEFDTP
ncbi:DUF397 domain-containing protein [Streptomyces sp. NPDC092296]|uniref:DUF397 domain-containing protein n=1 Tax=Streptomyces sp. NPDC092296 TaxID=3366012 RepID=UPI00382664A9